MMEKILLKEKHLDLYLNSLFQTQLTCTEIDLEALVMGYLITSGIIKDIRQVKSLEFLGDEVWITAAVDPMENSMPAGPSELLFSARGILENIQRFYQEAYMHKKTGAVHKCFLCDGEGMLYSADDMSRHNTVDKVIGMAALKRINLKKTYLIFTGRVPMDLMEKLVYAQIPMIVARSYPTLDALRLAREHHITLAGNAAVDGFQVYTGEERIIFDLADRKEEILHY
ncbi:MAG: hypothetical protein HGA49_08320 [Eubacteriaceae bacterium]|nr:hypothetical protein [Eubacteriaceae bacterium]